MISTTNDTIDQTKIFEQIKDDSCGAIVSFIGFVRDHNSKGKVEGIFYEAYDEMLEEILKKSKERFSKIGILGNLLQYIEPDIFRLEK
jgi:molybdopterin synthase catalytic subunit